MKYFDNKFGMFIHWGLYALTEQHEQAFAHLAIPREEYEGLQKQFNPVKYNPDEWVTLAKRNGMKYICFTTKHHDGFCMWDSAYTDYKITNTPYGKDVLKQLADACHKQGMLLSLYYSNPDWHSECAFNPYSTHQYRVANHEERLEEYKQYVKNQITELLTNYGEIYTLFWDIPPQVRDESINQLVRKLQPDILINDRGWDEGDFSTPERTTEGVSNGYFTRMTEACNSVGSVSWGYRRDEDFYSLRHLTYSIDNIMSKGGNYLLNVGPNALGQITDDYAEQLNRVGEWYNRMKVSLENTEPFGGCEVCWHNPIANKRDGKTYFHFENLTETAVTFTKYPSVPKSVKLLNTGKDLPFAIELMPNVYNESAVSVRKCLHIRQIPVDELQNEPIVLQIEW